jgi:predicted polyphosphate/ATP-dependent NAD kinase
MALTLFGFIVTGSDLDPDCHRAVMSSPTFTMIAVGVSTAGQGVQVARQLVDEGVELIELCGGFGPAWTVRVIDAIGGEVPVGSVAYGPESVAALAALFG